MCLGTWRTVFYSALCWTVQFVMTTSTSHNSSYVSQFLFFHDKYQVLISACMWCPDVSLHCDPVTECGLVIDLGVCLYWWVEDRPCGAWTTSCLALIPLSKSLSWQSLYETGRYPRLYMYRSSLLSCAPHKGRGVTIDSAAALGPVGWGARKETSPHWCTGRLYS